MAATHLAALYVLGRSGPVLRRLCAACKLDPIGWPGQRIDGVGTVTEFAVVPLL